VVPAHDRRRALPDRRHLVADRDRRDHDLAAARRDADQARLGDAPLPGIEVDVVDKHGTSVRPNQGGFLVIKRPWPSMLRTIFGDHQRFEQTYFGEIPGVYFAGDGARPDADGYFWIMGRVDDVINVAGHRLSTMEVESALVSHPKVAEAAVVGRPDELKGQAIVAFVTPKAGVTADEALAKELRGHVADQIGALARPEEIRFADALPKTRSGKIMRRLLREIASGSTARGDTTTLEDQAVLEKLAQSHAGDDWSRGPRRRGLGPATSGASTRPDSGGAAYLNSCHQPPLPLPPPLSAALVSLHLQRWSLGTPPSTCSTCMPQPANVGLLHLGQLTRRHMGKPRWKGQLIP
jgi:hypothetical protein